MISQIDHLPRNTVREQLGAGGIAIGTMALEFASTGLARTTASAGADFLIWDQEHTGYTSETIRVALAAARATSLVPVVRVPAPEPHHHIAAALDLGALGVMVPMVETPEQAAAIAAAMRYPPAGRRGFGVLYEDAHGGDVAAYCEHMNEQVLTIVQIETAEGLDNVEAIAAVEGVDVLWVGHFDLAASLGMPGGIASPTFQRALDTVIAACERHGKAGAMLAGNPKDGVDLVRRGMRCIGYGHDLELYREALRVGVSALREAASQASPRG